MTRKNIIEIRAEQAGLPPADYLRRVIAESGGKLVMVAERIGVTPARITQLMRQYGISTHHASAFEWRGTMDTMSGHCARYGLSDGNARVIRSRYRMSPVDALEKLLAIKIKRQTAR